MNKLKTLLFIVLNYGWVFPLFISISTIISFLNMEVSPKIYETEYTLNSFPYLELAEQMSILFITWASLAILVRIFQELYTKSPNSIKQQK
ncbi:hypothetical protein [Sulfurimonas sp.]|uniref:hypothetical protein n=1 Tax=Sulfurimonas sp. TaxID=2022749 RepID=UPI002B47FE0B|nr:hypothetical protein [Sulfurimonas sp.]